MVDNPILFAGARAQLARGRGRVLLAALACVIGPRSAYGRAPNGRPQMVQPGDRALQLDTTHRASGFKMVHYFVGSESLESPRASTSQDGQDLLIASIHGNKTGGYFVDLASNDATYISNTFVLERTFGWDGICIEANADFMWRLTQRRCALVAGVVGDLLDQNVSFALNTAAPGLSGIISAAGVNNMYKGSAAAPAVDAGASASVRRVAYRTVTLELVLHQLRAPPTIDYLSLDIEGAEMLALRNFPFQKHKFSTLTVERPTLYNDVLFAHRSTLGTPLEGNIRSAIAKRRAGPWNQKCFLNRERFARSTAGYPGYPGISFLS
ncbi:hypothetical protein T492DRAFT_835883 [Pavlovales sp. CCMP2436]|nr:hypothetical protein T492DRAFT_835883 [Pavlovales sp. CCMP2436]